MEPRRFQLEGPDLEALRKQVLSDHGPRARIVAAQKVTVGGIGGFLARRHYEVTVELPPRGRRAAAVPADGLPVPGATGGIGALLARAEAAERSGAGAAPSPSPPPPLPAAGVSTSSAGFAELMDQLTLGAGVQPGVVPQPRVPVPAIGVVPGSTSPGTGRGRVGAAGEPLLPLAGPGDLVLVAGLGGDPLMVCESMAAAAGAGPEALRGAGALEAPGLERAGDRRQAAAARAAGVVGGHGIYLAYGLGRGTELMRHTTLIGALAPDQVWVAVDAGRKAEDTAAWVAALRRGVDVAAVAVEGLATTLTPHTVNDLGLPVGWMDGGPAAWNRKTTAR